MSDGCCCCVCPHQETVAVSPLKSNPQLSLRDLIEARLNSMQIIEHCGKFSYVAGEIRPLIHCWHHGAGRFHEVPHELSSLNQPPWPADPGCHCVNALCGHSVSGTMSLRVMQLDVKCETKTKVGHGRVGQSGTHIPVCSFGSTNE